MNKKVKMVMLCLMMVLVSVVLCACGDDYTADDLRDAQERDAAGEELSVEDQVMVDGFKEWQAEQ